MKKQGKCDKCGTTMVKLFEYDDMRLCKANCCFQEELEKDSEKHLLDADKLEEYRKLVNGTKGIPISDY